MACGDKYASMLVTESGLTPNKPYEWWAGPEDYDEWVDVVGNVQRELLRRWTYLLDTERKLSEMAEPPVAGPYPERDQLESIMKDFVDQAEGVHGVLREFVETAVNLEFTWENSIRKAVETGRTGTCVLELIDNAVAYYGRPELPSSFVTREPGTGDEEGGGGGEPGIGGSLVTLALIGGTAYYLWKRKKRR